MGMGKEIRDPFEKDTFFLLKKDITGSEKSLQYRF